MSTAIEIHLTQKWREADKKVQELLKENEQLKGQVAEFERRQQIAIRNAYADGFEAGKEDTFKLLRKRR